MADTQSAQPSLESLVDRLELSLEQWRDHLTSLGNTLSPSEMGRLSRNWDEIRLKFEIACLHNGLGIPGLEAVMDPLPKLEAFDAIELEVTLDALHSARKTLTSMLAETRGRTVLLEELLASDKPTKMRKILEKMWAIDEALQTRLLGLDAYVDQFRLAELPGEDLLSTTAIVIEQSIRLKRLSDDNSALEAQTDQMKRWLSERKLSLARMPFTPPPSPDAMQEVSLSMSASSQADKALIALFSNHEKLKDAREYLENYLAGKESV